MRSIVLNPRRHACALALALASCIGTAHAADGAPDYYGTQEPFAKEAVYFVVTDRFVNGDPSNDQRDQGGPDPARRTFDGMGFFPKGDAPIGTYNVTPAPPWNRSTGGDRRGASCTSASRNVTSAAGVSARLRPSAAGGTPRAPRLRPRA